MLIIQMKEGEAIDRALKRLKRKYDRTRVHKDYRAREQFVKKSVLKRKELQRAQYIQSLKAKEDE